jgi:hypothetical protein
LSVVLHRNVRENDLVTAQTQHQLAQIRVDRDGSVARWLNERPGIELRETLAAAFSAGVLTALARTA